MTLRKILASKLLSIYMYKPAAMHFRAYETATALTDIQGSVAYTRKNSFTALRADAFLRT